MNFEKLTRYLDTLEEREKVPACDCKITKDHEVIYRKITGHSDYEKKNPLKEDNLFRLFSATKLLTVTAVLQLVERGRIGLYDELARYLPEFGTLYVADQFVFEHPIHWPRTGEPCHLAHHSIRIIDLLTMTAGLSYDTASKELMEVKRRSGNKASTREVVAQIAGMPLVYEPGTRWSYGLEHDVLAAVIEVVSGTKFANYLKTFIFEPLEIEDLYFHWDEDKKKKICAMYMGVFGTDEIKPDDGTLSDGFKITDHYESGGAGLAGTVDAYSIFADALCSWGVGANGKRILGDDMIRLLMTGYTTGVMQKDFEQCGKVGYRYGLGVRVLSDQTKSKSPCGEFGWDGAAGAYVLIDPIHRISISYAQHIVGFPKVYTEIHPVIRDLAYDAIFG